MNEFIYLDNASTAFPKPNEVTSFMFDFYKTHGVNPSHSGFDLSVETEEIVVATRKRLTQFFNGKDYKRLIFTYNASDALNLVINGILTPGSHVITSTLEHNSVLRPLYQQQLVEKIELDYLPFDGRGYLNPDDLKSKIKSNTRAVILNHGSNVLGTIQPIAAIGQICLENEIPFVVNAAQTAGIIPIDVQAMNIDVLVFTGHKALMGPSGIGGFYVSEKVNIKPTRFGGTGIDSLQRTQPEKYPYRLECGAINIIGVAGLYAGQNWIFEKAMENIYRQEMQLWKMLRDGLEQIEGIHLYCATSEIQHLPILALNIENLPADRLRQILDEEHHIATQAGFHCAPLVHQQLGTVERKGMLRISIGAFNKVEQIKLMLEAIAEIATMVRK